MKIILLVTVLSHFFLSYLKQRKQKAEHTSKNTINISIKMKYALWLKDFIIRPTIVALLILYTINGASQLFLRIVPALWLQYTGLAIILLSIVLKAWAYYNLGGNWSSTISIYEKQSLTTTGPYKFIQHPVYFSYLILSAGILFVTGSITLLMLGLITFGIDTERSLVENKELSKKFSKEFAPAMYTTIIILTIVILLNIIGGIDEVIFLISGRSYTMPIIINLFPPLT